MSLLDGATSHFTSQLDAELSEVTHLFAMSARGARLVVALGHKGCQNQGVLIQAMMVISLFVTKPVNDSLRGEGWIIDCI